MALVINNNLMSLAAANSLNRTYGQLSTSVSRLSSGLRITGARDDAAGLAVRELMRSDVAVLNQGVRNANDAISMLTTMDGAAAVIDEKLIRMKELAEQAATGTYNTDQRTVMNDEFDAMRDEISRIAEATDFNGIKILNGVSGTTIGGVDETQRVVAEANTGTGSTSAINAFTSLNSATTTTVSWTDENGNIGAGAAITITAATTSDMLAASINALTSGAFTVSFVNGGVGGGDYLLLTAATSGATSMSLSINENGGAAEYAGVTSSTGVAGRTVSDIRIHFGTGNDSAEDYYYIEAQDLTTSALSLDALCISNQNSAKAALSTIDTAVVAKDTARAHFGAMINRLEGTATNLTIQSENIQAAESQISDVDIATEMTKFTNAQVKAQAAVAMLAQANMLPQMAMSLLGG